VDVDTNASTLKRPRPHRAVTQGLRTFLPLKSFQGWGFSTRRNPEPPERSRVKDEEENDEADGKKERVSMTRVLFGTYSFNACRPLKRILKIALPQMDVSEGAPGVSRTPPFGVWRFGMCSLDIRSVCSILGRFESRFVVLSRCCGKSDTARISPSSVPCIGDMFRSQTETVRAPWLWLVRWA
jgi:hypothetical protein